MRHGVRLEVNVEPGVLSAPGVSIGVRSGVRLVLMFWEKPELRLCVMPEIIILVCSVVRVRPLLYTDEHSALRAKRSSRSFDTLDARRARSRRRQIKRTGPFFFLIICIVPLDELISKGEFPVQENLEVDHLLPEDVLTLQKVTCDLGLVQELNSRLEALCVLCRRRPTGQNRLKLLRGYTLNQYVSE